MCGRIIFKIFLPVSAAATYLKQMNDEKGKLDVKKGSH